MQYIKRAIEETVLHSNKTFKSILVTGARQTGKTELLKTLFPDKKYVPIDDPFIEDQANNNPNMFMTLNPPPVIFDEVQCCPEALTSLKYFCEDANEYHVMATGSLLGVSVNRGENSFPVGKVQFMNMYPMDFEEYLLARGEEFLIRKIRECFKSALPMEDALHEKALSLYREYMFIGGMPAVVSDYIKNGNAQLASILQSDILEAYLDDMGKYNKKSEVAKTRLVYRNISTQLSKENRKFQYRYIKSGGRASEFEDAIEWVCLAGMARRVFRLEQEG